MPEPQSQSASLPDNVRSQPVTVLVRRVIKPGREQDFEAWMRGTTADLSKFPGYLDITLIRPPTAANKREYTLLIRFDNYDHVDNWENSAVRNEWMAKAQDFTENLTNQRVTGLEYWFSLPEVPKSSVPPRWKMALITSLAIYPLSSAVSLLFGSYLAEIPFWWRGVVTSLFIVFVMTYLWMPVVTGLFSKWLFKRS
jgi:uncharacterized protein